MRYIILLALALIIAAGTVCYGRRAKKGNGKWSVKKAIFTSASAFGTVMMIMVLMAISGVPVFAETEAAAAAAKTGASLGDGFKYLAAALSTGLATIGTGLAVGSVGSSAVGAVSEDQSILGKTLIYVGMAEGIAIYGMIISILILFV